MIYCMGEALIDLMQEGDCYIPFCGGAPLNAAIHAARQGAATRFIGKLSNDAFGDKLYHYQLEEGIVLKELKRSEYPTTLALVSHINGERSFSFYRKETADLYLDHSDIDKLAFNKNDILHFCSLGLAEEGTTRAAHRYAVQKMKEAGGSVSFDVNIRSSLWGDLDKCIAVVREFMKEADIVKVNEEELELLSGSGTIEERMRQLQSSDKQIIIATLAQNGAKLLYHDTILTEPGLAVRVIDTTGAGDSFIGMFLALAHEKEIDDINLRAMMKASVELSSKVVGLLGASPQV